MNRRLLFFRFLRILCPFPRPSIAELDDLYKQAADARDFMRRLLCLSSFDSLNKHLTRKFAYAASTAGPQGEMSSHAEHLSVDKDAGINETLILQSARDAISAAKLKCEMDLLSMASEMSGLLCKLHAQENSLARMLSVFPDRLSPEHVSFHFHTRKTADYKQEPKLLN